jgi:hypothetical protein
MAAAWALVNLAVIIGVAVRIRSTIPQVFELPQDGLDGRGLRRLDRAERDGEIVNRLLSST